MATKLGLILAVPVVLAACATKGPDREIEPVFANAIEEARAGGASDAQIAQLEHLAQKGEVELADVREALAGTYTCLEQAGISYQERVETTRAGVVTIVYDMRQPASADADAGMATSDECARVHSQYVEMLYMTQPSVVEVQDRYMATVVAPAFLDCYDQYGVAADSTLSARDQWAQAYDVIFAVDGVRPGDPTLEGCLYAVMVDFGT